MVFFEIYAINLNPCITEINIYSPLFMFLPSVIAKNRKYFIFKVRQCKLTELMTIYLPK